MNYLQIAICQFLLASLFLGGFLVSASGQAVSPPATNAAGAAEGANASAPSLDLAITDSAWVLRPNDVVSVVVYQEDDLSTKVTIDVSGNVMLPLLGQVSIGGLTLAQATARIQDLYNKDYLVNPRVNLVVEQFASRRFAVLGQVQHPGSYDFPQNEPLNLLEAIAVSGGYTRLGAPNKVSVRRIENGAPKIYHLNADDMANDQSKRPFDILPNDIITIGERTF